MTVNQDRSKRTLAEQFNSLKSIKVWLRTYKTGLLFGFQAEQLGRSLEAFVPAAAEDSANA